MLNRRHFIARTSALAGVTGAPALLGACATGPASPPASSGPDASTPVNAANAANAVRAQSFRNFEAAVGPSEVRFDRPLPAELTGTLYRNGPARMQRGDTTYRHWFDGDGMVQALALQGSTLRHRGAMIDTDRSRAEASAGRFLWPGFGTSFADARSVRKGDDVNVGNISVLPLGGELLALWEGGSAWRVDRDTLATRGRKVFDADTDGAPFSAHPRVDPDGRVWNFGYAGGSGKLLIYDIDRSGALKRHALIDAPNADMVHDFAVTTRHLVFVLTPVLRKAGDRREVQAFADTLEWRADKPAWLLVVDKDTLAVTHRVELPNFFCFHLGNAWVDAAARGDRGGDRGGAGGGAGGGTLRVQVARTAPFDELMQQIAAASSGSVVGGVSRRTLEIALDLSSGRASIVELPLVNSEFPRFDPRRTGLRSRHLLMLGRDAKAPEGAFGLNTVQWFDRERGHVTRFSYGERAFAEEHVFVPRAGGAEGEGWVLGTALDWQAQRTMMSVFDAQALDAGPIATARLPYMLPMGLHGQFVSA
jgi:all-trans-8'-apo-beta-carotenal 15,15'-oxygenase